MRFRCETTAKTHLSHISYYRLKGYWWDMQADKKNHTFMPDTYFEDVLAIYYFDKELRLILFDAIESIEIALRTKMIYHLSQSYGGLFYNQSELFKREDLHLQSVKKLKEEFHHSQETFAKEFRAKHEKKEEHGVLKLTQEPDAWVIFEVATFVTLSKMYKNLADQLPEAAEIAKDFGLNSHKELSSWLESISYLRNVIANHSRIFGKNLIKWPMNLKAPRFDWINSRMVGEQQQKPYNTITAMLYLCNAIGEGQRFKERLFSFTRKNPNIELSRLGFPSYWRNEPIWRELPVSPIRHDECIVIH